MRFYIATRLVAFICLLTLIANRVDARNPQNLNRDTVRCLSTRYNHIIVSSGHTEPTRYNDINKDSIINSAAQDLIIYANTQKNLTVLIDRDSRARNLTLLLNSANNVVVNSQRKLNLRLIFSSRGATKFDTLYISNTALLHCDLNKAKIEHLIIKDCNISKLLLNEAEIFRTFSLLNGRIDTAELNNTLLPSYIAIHSINLDHAQPIDFKHLKAPLESNESTTYGLERTLGISNTDLDKLLLPYDRFSFHIDTLQHPTRKIWIYEKLLKHLKEAGLIGKYEWYESEYEDIIDNQEHQWLTNQLNIFWWGKGHHKSRTVKIALGAFLLFFIINGIFFDYLRQVYWPSSFDDYFARIQSKQISKNIERKQVALNKVKYYTRWCFGTMLYTSFIFWGLRLDIHDLKLRNPFVVLYVIFQYVLGLLFLAYIINFIVVRS